MNVLIACEESQTVCTEFRKLGHRAFSCDLQECSGGHPEWHIQGDVLPLINGRCSFTTADTHTHTQADRWDLLIAHPPCTYLSNAGACRMFRVIDGEQFIVPERYKLMLEGREFFFKFMNADCERIAVENPLPMKICKLPEPTQIVQPFDFGHPYSKRTLLWLKNLPPLQPTKYMDSWKPWLPSNTSALKEGRGWKGSIQGSKNYAKTFQGIAQAMAEQWSAYILKGELPEGGQYSFW